MLSLLCLTSRYITYDFSFYWLNISILISLWSVEISILCKSLETLFFYFIYTFLWFMHIRFIDEITPWNWPIHCNMHKCDIWHVMNPIYNCYRVNSYSFLAFTQCIRHTRSFGRGIEVFDTNYTMMPVQKPYRILFCMLFSPT